MRIKNRVSSLAAITAATALALAACSGGSDNGNEGGDGGNGAGDGGDVSVTFLPKNLGNPYFDASAEGGEAALEEIGGTVAEVGPSEATPDAQGSYINTLTQQQVGAIAASANDPTAICDALVEAKDAGGKVVTSDSDTASECRDLFINQADADGIARAQIDLKADQIGCSDVIAILSTEAHASLQTVWIMYTSV